MRITPRIYLIGILIATLTSIACALVVTAISNNVAAGGGLVPTSYGTTYQGTAYCGYKYDPVEADYFGYTCRPYLWPANPPVPSMADYALATLMWHTYLADDGYINGGGYYDHVLLPASRRTTTIIVSRRSYLSTGQAWNTQHITLHNTYVKQYPPTFKQANDTSAHPKTYRGDRYAAKANQAADVTQKQTAKKYGGANAGQIADPAKAKQAGNAGGGYSGSANAADQARTKKSGTTNSPRRPSTTTRRTTRRSGRR